jgi:hypothetical protein
MSTRRKIDPGLRAIQSAIYRRYPGPTHAAMWVRILASGDPEVALTIDNVDRYLRQNPSPEDRAALNWLRDEIFALIRERKAKRDAKAKVKPQAKDQPQTAEQMTLDFGPCLKPFFDHAPHRPYCTNNLAEGLQVRPFRKALAYRYLQANSPAQVWTIVIDIDRDIAAQASGQDWTLGGPEANAIALNSENGHGHALIYLAAGVTRTSAGRLAPLRYLAAIERGLCFAYGGDPAYSGLITKNPISKAWQTVERHGKLWTLDEIAAALDLSAANAKTFTPEPGEAYGSGRNVSLFHETRFWAYKAIRDFWAPNGFPQWHEAVLGHVEALNGQFSAPLPYSEIKSISKSIAGWTWKRMTPLGLRELIAQTHTSELQRERGRKATNQAEAGRASGSARWQAKEAQRVTARLMRAAGHSYRAIGEALGVSLRTVHYWLDDGEIVQ